jgi:hypothetical protein
MKLKLAAIFLIYSILFTSLASSAIQRTLYEWFERKIVDFGSTHQSFFQQAFTNVDSDCLNEKLKITENGDKKMTSFEAIFLITSTASYCVDNLDTSIDRLLSILSHGFQTEQPDCFRQLLKTVEPDASILGDFENYAGDCEDVKNIKMGVVDGVIERFEEDIEKSVEDFTCGAVTKSEYEKIILKLPIMKFGGLNEENLEAEKVKIRATIGEKMKEVSKCLLGKL